MKKLSRHFKTPLGMAFEKYLKLQRSLGSLMRSDEYMLIKLQHFLKEFYPRLKTITREVVVHYLKTRGHLFANSLHTELSQLRKLCRFLYHQDTATYIPERALIPAVKRKLVPYIYTQNNIDTLLAQARQLGPDGSLRARTYVTLIALLWVTGLRIREALRLDLQDIDQGQGMIRICQTKFFKSRLVPISPSATQALEDYLKQRESFGHDQRPSAPLFVNQRGRRVSYISASLTFRGLIRHCGIKTPQGTRPRIHDLRHSFATRILNDCCHQGRDATAYLPVLATYLGHVNIQYTQVYLHPSFDLLKLASAKFNQYAHIKTEVQ